MDSLSKKILIAYQIALRGEMNDNFDGKFENEPINKLLTNYEDIETIIKSGKERIYLFLYFVWKNVLKILWDKDSLIDLNEQQNKNNNLSELFYLDLMMQEEIQNFDYPLEFIENINKIQNLDNNEIYKKVIYSKIIIDLIKNFNQEVENDSLEKIEEFNNKIIEDNLSEFNKIINNKGVFEEGKIDEIYSSILEKLIRNNEFKNYDYVLEILKQLEFENIYLTDKMLENLKKILNSSEDFINNYKISDIFDLINDNAKVNFYFILFKYILKNPFYIYQIEFLENFRKVIIDSLKTNLSKIKNSLKLQKDNNEKIIYIIKSLDSAYYYFNKPIKENLKSSNKKNISSTDTTIPKSHDKNASSSSLKLNKVEEKVENILKNFYFEIDFNINENKDNDDDNSYFKKMKLINDIKPKDIVIPKLLNNFKKFKTVLFEFDKVLNTLDKLNNKNAFLEMQFERTGENEDQDFYIIDCKFDLFIIQGEKLTKLKSFKAYNILETGIVKTQAFLYLKKTSVQIINKKFSKLNPNTSLVSSSSSSITGLKSYKPSIFYSSLNAKNVENYLNNKKYFYEITTIDKILFKHNKEAEFIVETPNHYFISFGIDNDVFIYNSNFKKVDEFVIHSNAPNNNINNNLQLSKNDIIICSIKGVDLIKYNQSNSKYSVEKLKNEPSTFFFKINNNNYLFATKNDLIILKSLNQQTDKKPYVLAGGIQLGEMDAAFTSNSNLPGGRDKIYFYYSNKGEISDGGIKEEYSFTVSNHSMELMPNKKGVKTFLLCACKKYKKAQKNGILAINLGKDNEYKWEFCNTKDFEVFCFCPLYIIIENNSKENYNKKMETVSYSTNYFLVGGFEVDKKKGAIKLFKLNDEDKDDDKDYEPDDKKDKVTIEFVQDIEFENKTVKRFKNNDKSKKPEYEPYDFTGFQRNISCITQSQKTGKLLITCWDGNVYLCSAPNISFYLNQDLEEDRNKKNKYNEIPKN